MGYLEEMPQNAPARLLTPEDWETNICVKNILVIIYDSLSDGNNSIFKT